MAFLSNIFGYFLNFIYGFVNNYGIAIIIFTIVLKLIMLPFTIKQQRNMKKTAKVQAEVRVIQEKFSNDQVRQSQELMDLYKRENMSPFSGCLYTIVQMIVILSMFWLVSRPLTYMKHVDNEILQGYIQEISEESEGQNVRYSEIAVIKKYGQQDENVYINMDFFGLDLSDVPSDAKGDFRVYIIPLLYVVTSIITMKITSKLTAIPKPEEVKSEEMVEENKDKEVIYDPNLEEKSNEEPQVELKAKGKKKKKKENSEEKQEKEENNKVEESSKEKALVKTETDENEEENNEYDAMEEATKQMQIMTPVLSVMIALIAPLGLALYWLVSNILNILERIIIVKFFKDE